MRLEENGQVGCGPVAFPLGTNDQELPLIGSIQYQEAARGYGKAAGAVPSKLNNAIERGRCRNGRLYCLTELHKRQSPCQETLNVPRMLHERSMNL